MGKIITDIKKLMHNIDLFLRPVACVIHPDTLKKIKKNKTNLGKEVVFYPTVAAEKGKCYVMKREELERCMEELYDKKFKR